MILYATMKKGIKGAWEMDRGITEILRDKGFKVTPQRLAIYKILKESYDHPSAEMVYEKLQSRYPTMSLATVYKTIEVFLEIDLVHYLNVGEDKARYDAHTHPHAHMVCDKCSEILDIEDSELKNLQDSIEVTSGYQINRARVYFHGVCPKCAKKSAN